MYNDNLKKISIVAIILLGILGISFIIYFFNKDNDYEELGEFQQENLESASTEIGKSVEESKVEISNNFTNAENSLENFIFSSENEIENSNNVNSVETSSLTNSNTNSNTDSINGNVSKENTNTINDNSNDKIGTSSKNSSSTQSKTSQKNSTSSTTKSTISNNSSAKSTSSLNFEKPISGEIIRGYSKENLVYSETLKEWIIHNGVDIKADKTSNVMATESGTVSAIKNDPRYGITVIVSHDNGYQSVYANLLTAEFVVEGEKVKKGQTLGTVGNSSSFEVCDEYHLHFEITKDGEYVDPTSLIKFE